jgi:hypothetical protein
MNFSSYWIAIAVIIFLMTHICLAADSATIAATLRDEASECRYLLALCEEARMTSRKEAQSLARVEEKKKAYHTAKQAADKAGRLVTIPSRDSTLGGIRVYRNAKGELYIKPQLPRPLKVPSPAAKAEARAQREIRNVEAAGETDILAHSIKKERLTEAAKVIRIKHEKMPECFRQCEILDLQSFD